jgi:branched-chain amino acid transport system permease protein
VSGRGGVRVVLGAALVLMPLVAGEYWVNVITQGLIFAIFAMSLDLLLGYAGLPALGHAAFFGVGAYTVALLSLRLHTGVGVNVVAGIAMAALLASVFALLALRTRGAYFLMITLGMAQLVWGLAWSWRALTRGDDGLSGIPRPELPGLPALWDPGAFYYFVLVVAAGAAALLACVVRSPFGHALRGLRENELRLQFLGYRVWWYQYVCFVVAGAFAGLAGVLYGYFSGFVNPSLLSVRISAEVLLMVVLGGAGTLAGPAAGALGLAILQSLVSDYTRRWLLILGVLYLGVALLAPRGLPAFIRDRLRAETAR